MNGRVRTFFDLVRLPNLFTAAADVVAGFFYAGGALNDWPTFLPIVFASMFLYGGGVALNDVCDARRDAHELQGRPIPSGRITRRTATVFSIALLLIGVGLAATAGPPCFAVASAIVVAIVLYDWVLKSTPLAPVMMGACRGLNLGLGLSLTADMLTAPTLAPMGLYVLYVASLTLFAKNEATVDRSHRRRLILTTMGCVVGIALLLALPLLSVEVVGSSRFAIVLGSLVVLIVGLMTAANPTPASVQRAVKTLIVMLVWFDACIAWTSGGALAGTLVASLILPTLLLGRWFRVT